MEARQETATWLSRWVLVVALLSGLVLAYGLGHVCERAAPALAGGHTAAMSHEGPSVHDHASAHDHASVLPVDHRSAGEQGHQATPAPPEPLHGVGIAVVCLALIGVGVPLLLLARAPLRRLRVHGPETVERLVHECRAFSPPGSLLTRLSLLRI
ncbi:hypothetical protein ABZO31_29890 [Streptomyces sp. HUAS MG47]|uniref:hypothetical protein n=1 Tax=Streptomyces solicamelliae TaxID=3231716 RepID=UPI003877C6DD